LGKGGPTGYLSGTESSGRQGEAQTPSRATGGSTVDGNKKKIGTEMSRGGCKARLSERKKGRSKSSFRSHPRRKRGTSDGTRRCWDRKGETQNEQSVSWDGGMQGGRAQKRLEEIFMRSQAMSQHREKPKTGHSLRRHDWRERIPMALSPAGKKEKKEGEVVGPLLLPGGETRK